jgi:hypothetical protein
MAWFCRLVKCQITQAVPAYGSFGSIVPLSAMVVVAGHA